MENKTNAINIAMASDDNYQIMYIAICSIIRNASCDNSFHFFILTEGEYSDNIKKQLVELVEPGIIEFYNVENRFKGVSTHLRGIPTPTYYRLLLPEILNEYDRVLYLDTDVIVLNDLTELYNQPLDGYLVGGVLAYAYPSPNEGIRNQYKEKIGLDSLDSYINAGVMLMNLDEMRQIGFVDQSMGLIGYDFPCQDQDIINRICADRILKLPFKYNTCNVYYDWKKHQYMNQCTDEELRDALSNPVIIHYANWNMKPWNCLNAPLSEVWWSICRSSNLFDYFWDRVKDIAFYHLFYKRQDNVCKTWGKSAWELFELAEHIVVYGAGKVAHEIIEEMRYRRIIIDNVMLTKKDKEIFMDIPVISVDDNYYDPNSTLFVIATNEENSIEILKELHRRGYYKILTLKDEGIE